MSISTLLCAIVILHCIFLTDVKCSDVVDETESIDQYEDLTDQQPDHSESPADDRRRRSSDYVWTLRVHWPNGSYSELNLIETDGILANSQTPLMAAKSLPKGKVGYRPLKETLVDKVGEFSLWQDPEQEAAVVYYHEHGKVFGHVQWRGFKLRNIGAPKREKRGASSEEDSSKGSKSGSHSEEDSIEEPSGEDKPSSGEHAGGLRPGGLPDRAYAELVLVLDWDYVKDDEEKALQEMLAWWNYADMLYIGLEKPAIKLNIAMIVIAQSDHINPWIKKVYRKKSDSFVPVQGLAAAGRYYAAQKAFPDDKYDIIVVYTSTIMRTPAGGAIGGVSHVGTSCQKKQDRMILISYKVAPYNAGAHELGHVFGSKHDQQYEECKSGHRMMSTKDPRDYDGLRWSDCSVNAIHEYFKKTISTCFDNCPTAPGIVCP